MFKLRLALILCAAPLVGCGQPDESESDSSSNLSVPALPPIATAVPVAALPTLASVAIAAPIDVVPLMPKKRRFQIIYRDPGVEIMASCMIDMSFSVKGIPCSMNGTLVGTGYAPLRSVFVCVEDTANAEQDAIAAAYALVTDDDAQYAQLEAETSRILWQRVAEGITGEDGAWIAKISWSYGFNTNIWCHQDIAPDAGSGSFSMRTDACHHGPRAAAYPADVISVGVCE